jgi:hypothetical protein
VVYVFQLVMVFVMTHDSIANVTSQVAPGDVPCEVIAGDFFGMWQAGSGVLGIRWPSTPDR